MIFFRAFVFGVTLAIAIGPIALLIIRFAVTNGFRAGIASACGAALADLTYATIAVSVGNVIAPTLAAHTTQAYAIAALTLIAFGLWLLWTAIRPGANSPSTADIPSTARSTLAPLFTTYALTAANPLTVIAFLAFLAQLPLDAPAMTRVVAAGGLFAGSLSIQLVLAAGGAVLGRVFASARSLRLLNAVSGGGILLFGLFGLLR